MRADSMERSRLCMGELRVRDTLTVVWPKCRAEVLQNIGTPSSTRQMQR